MSRSSLLELIRIDDFSATPKYQQLVNSIIDGIRKNQIEKGDMLPSINEVSFEFDISRVTVEKGYNELRKLGVIDSHPGKGYFVKNIDLKQKLKIFLLFNKLSEHKKLIYDSLVNSLGDSAAIDFYVYNNDFGLFQRIINNRETDYTHYVIIPHFIEDEDKAVALINTLPKERLIIVDKLYPEIGGDFSAVYENFEDNIYSALKEALPALSKYKGINLIFPENSYYPKGIVRGVQNFCFEFAFSHRIIHRIEEETLQKGEVYINVMEGDLVILLEKVLHQKLELGKEIGIISYNETPLKQFIMNGLTTVSTDFVSMGKSLAHLVLNPSNERIENPFSLTLRKSI